MIGVYYHKGDCQSCAQNLAKFEPKGLWKKSSTKLISTREYSSIHLWQVSSPLIKFYFENSHQILDFYMKIVIQCTH